MLKIKEKPKRVKFKIKRGIYSQKTIKKVVMYLHSELRSSTIHGLPHIVNMEIHWFERLFWAASFAFCACFIVVLISFQYARYLAAPTVMSVEKDYFNWNVSFPAITLCPLNKLDENLQADFVNSFLETDGEALDLEPYLEAISLASINTIHLLQMPVSDNLHLINTTDYARVAAKVFRKFQNESLTTNTKWPMSIEPIMTEMGMCHVINSNVASADNPSKWSESVPYTKSNIELSFHDSDFNVQILDYADSFKIVMIDVNGTPSQCRSNHVARVAIATDLAQKRAPRIPTHFRKSIYTHSPNDIILSGTPALSFDEEGFLQFGLQISSARASPDLRSMALYRRKCRFIDEPDSDRYPVYSYNRCLMECRIRMIKKLCGCIPHFYKPIGDEKVCNFKELKCLVIYMKEIMSFSMNNETEGIERIELIGGFPKSPRDCGCLPNCEGDMYRHDLETFVPQADINRLKIEVASYPRVRIRREIIFNLNDAVLKIGGVVNLCIGASVISIMELIMTVIRVPIYEIIQAIKGVYQIRRKSKVWYIFKKEK